MRPQAEIERIIGANRDGFSATLVALRDLRNLMHDADAFRQLALDLLGHRVSLVGGGHRPRGRKPWVQQTMNPVRATQKSAPIAARKPRLSKPPLYLSPTCPPRVRKARR